MTIYTNTTTLQANGGMPSNQTPFTAADNTFAQAQSASQALAENVGNFLLFNPSGLVDGARSNQAMSEVRNTVIYLTASVISAAGASPGIWNTQMIDWPAT